MAKSRSLLLKVACGIASFRPLTFILNQSLMLAFISGNDWFNWYRVIWKEMDLAVATHKA